MSDMKCPFCGEKLKPYYGYGIELYSCSNLTCKGTYMEAEDEVWQELISTCKALGVAVDMLKEIDWCAQDYAKAQEALAKITSLTKGDDNE